MQDEQNKRLSELERKWLDGTISSEEEIEYMEWYNRESEDSVIVPSTSAMQEPEHQERLFAGIQAKMHTPAFDALGQVVSIRRMSWMRYAAAVVFLVVSGSAAYLWFNKGNDRHMLTDDNKQLTIVPGHETAILTLADGSTIALDRVNNGMLAQQGNSSIVKLANGQIAYNLEGLAQGEVLMNTMSTPKGGRYQLVLPDGTKVWLNAASSITYPAAFVGSGRNVRVSGEVYMEVVKDKSRPFRVDVDGKSVVEVLGTSFNVNSYADEGSIKTTLLEGSVRVGKANLADARNDGVGVILKPGQQAIQEEKKKISVSNNADLEQVIAWKNGYFDFDRVDIQTVMRRIERWYDVEVVFEGNITHERLMGELPMNASIERVLNILKQLDVQFRIEGKKIVVTGIKGEISNQ